MSRPCSFPMRPLRYAILFFAFCCSPSLALAQKVDCLMCHGALLEKRPVVHAAVQMGCPSCHAGIDATEIPHKKTTAAAKGLSADLPDLCYGCHDKPLFTRKTVHPALAMGCTGCHDPHASTKPKLLSADVPDQCFGCHDKAEFSRKNVHAPVAGGMCLSCHNPHSSNNIAMLVKPVFELCSGCHDQVIKNPHAIAAFVQGGHPLGQAKKDMNGKTIAPPEDPLRKGKFFSCASCHLPHSSDFVKLFRYAARSTMQLCTHCHRF